MSTDGSPDAAGARGALSRHGYGFHHAVIRETRRLGGLRVSAWKDDGTEFPVEVNGLSTQVDLLLRSTKGLLVCECKRVDPALGTWCFARSALSTQYTNEAWRIATEIISFDQDRAFVVRRDELTSDKQYHVALELKTGAKGESQGTSRGAIEDAVTQALKGANGISNAIAADRRLLRGQDRLKSGLWIWRWFRRLTPLVVVG